MILIFISPVIKTRKTLKKELGLRQFTLCFARSGLKHQKIGL